MIPPEKPKPPLEKLPTNKFVEGIIEDITYDTEHLFKGYGKDEKGNPKPDSINPAVRITIILPGYKYPRKTPWMRFSYSDKSNLYKTFVEPLVAGAKPYMKFDLDQIKGMKVNILWKDKGDFQNIVTVTPADGQKIVPIITEEEAA